MTLLIARHGQTDWNVERRWQSRTDIPLNATGYRQATRLGALLRAQGFAPVRVISSPLIRAWKTAAILGEALGQTVRVEPVLTELDLGEYEGRLEVEIRAADGAGYDKWREGGYLQPAPGGEGIKDVADRVKDFVDSLDDTSGDILLVGHQGVNMAIKAQLSDCFTRDCLASFRQDNDEIDLWRLNPASALHRLRADSDDTPTSV
jgi:broad specificity phosphatase PhoE